MPAIKRSLLLAVLAAIALQCNPARAELKLAQAQKMMIFAPVYYMLSSDNLSGKPKSRRPELTTIIGIFRVSAALVRGEIDIGLTGPETAIYPSVPSGDRQLVIIGALANRDGQFLLGRDATPTGEFAWGQLKGKSVLSWRRSSTPGYMFHAAIAAKNVDGDGSIKFRTDPITPRIYHRIWRGGEVEFGAFFEPAASWYQRNGHGRIVASVGKAAGPSIYTVLVTTRRTVQEKPEKLQKFMSALQQGLNWVHSEKPETIARTVKPFLFRGSIQDIASGVKRYRSIQFWNRDLRVPKKGFERLQDILVQTGAMRASTRVKYDDVVVTRFADRAHRDHGQKKP